MRELESILEQADKPAIYADLLHAADSRPPEHGALVAIDAGEAAVRSATCSSSSTSSGWRSTTRAAQRLIDSPACARYRHYLAAARRYRPHMLSEPEEQLLEETANTGRRAFRRLFDEVLSALTLRGRGRRRAPDGSTRAASSRCCTIRGARCASAAAAALTATLREQSLLLTFIFNVTAQDHALIDRLRRYPDPMASRHLANEIDAGDGRRR